MVERFSDGEQEDWNDDDSWGLDEENENEYISEATAFEEETKFGDDLGQQKVFQAGHTVNKHYNIIDKNEIHLVQNQRINEVHDELGISKDLASALLVKNGWNAQAAIDALLR